MPISKETIDQWLLLPDEHPQLEFKTAKDNFDSTSLYRYCVGIANEGGGHFVLGISDEKPRQVVGSRAFPNPQAVEEQIFDKLKFRVDIEEFDYNGFRILIFIIPSRPQGTPYSLEGTYYMRSGSRLFPMSPDRLRIIFEEGRVDWLEEYSAIGLDSQNVIDRLDTQKFFELFQLPYPPNRSSVLDRL